MHDHYKRKDKEQKLHSKKKRKDEAYGSREK